eukprot:1204998-Rhodomonas_salina.3
MGRATTALSRRATAASGRSLRHQYHTPTPPIRNAQLRPYALLRYCVGLSAYARATPCSVLTARTGLPGHRRGYNHSGLGWYYARGLLGTDPAYDDATQYWPGTHNYHCTERPLYYRSRIQYYATRLDAVETMSTSAAYDDGWPRCKHGYGFPLIGLGLLSLVPAWVLSAPKAALPSIISAGSRKKSGGGANDLEASLLSEASAIAEGLLGRKHQLRLLRVYARGTECPVLRERMVLPGQDASVRAVRSCSSLRACYAMSGTDIPYGAACLRAYCEMSCTDILYGGRYWYFFSCFCRRSLWTLLIAIPSTGTTRYQAISCTYAMPGTNKSRMLFGGGLAHPDQPLRTAPGYALRPACSVPGIA